MFDLDPRDQSSWLLFDIFPLRRLLGFLVILLLLQKGHTRAAAPVRGLRADEEVKYLTTLFFNTLNFIKLFFFLLFNTNAPKCILQFAHT